jgi:hypothetical protein
MRVHYDCDVREQPRVYTITSRLFPPGFFERELRENFVKVSKNRGDFARFFVKYGNKWGVVC